MKVRDKLYSIGFMVIIGFMTAAFLIYTNFQVSMKFKSLELQGVKIQTLQNELSLQSAEFISDKNRIEDSYESWQNAYSSFSKELKVFTDNNSLQDLGGKIDYTLNQINNSWDIIFNDYYKPVNLLLNNLINDRDLQSIDTIDTSIIDLYEKLQADEIENDELIEKFTLLEKNMQFIDASHIHISQMFDLVLDEINVGISRLIMDQRVQSIQLVGLILAFIVIISSLFSRQTTIKITKMESYIAKLANGNFSAKLDIRSKDEFGQLTTNFDIFTENLWIKMDSLRDVMRDIGNSISIDLNQQEFIDNVVELAIDSSKAESGIMFSVNEESKKLVVSNITGYFPPPFQISRKISDKKENITTYFKSLSVDIGQGIIGTVASSGEPLFIRDSSTDNRLPFNSFSEDELYISSLIFIPLLIGNRLLGILGLCKTTSKELFSDLDYSFLRSFGEYSAMALDNLNKYKELLSRHELLRELTVASDIQKNLLPQKLPISENASMFAFSEAAKGISGDYYDAFNLPDDKVLITVCDVAGKGVPASLVMIMIRTILRLITINNQSARSVVTELNNLLTEKLGIDHFATIGLFIYDNKENVISYTNGAHHPLYVYKSSSEKILKYDTDGLPLGLEANTKFGQKKFQVSHGDYLVLFTDGLNEARNKAGEEYSTNRILSIVKKNSKMEPEELTKEIMSSLNTFTAGTNQHDDQTLLLMKIK